MEIKCEVASNYIIVELWDDSLNSGMKRKGSNSKLIATKTKGEKDGTKITAKVGKKYTRKKVP